VADAGFEDEARAHRVLPLWIVLCGALLGMSLLLPLFGDYFAWERSLASIPALWLTGGLIVAGLIYALLVPLIRWTLQSRAPGNRRLLTLVLLTGLAMRLVMIPSMPALESDFYRYLWDGAVTANGHNPYALAPGSARTVAAPAAIRQLAVEGTLVLDRINHPDLKTIYPPVAQAAFALSYWIEPWSMRAWRLVCLAGECASVVLLLVLLGAVGRSPLWVSLYWLNPLVVKELMNAGHMEAVVLPFVLGAITLVAISRPVLASASLGLAIGAKLWPAMLVPLVLRPLLSSPSRLLMALLVLSGMAVAWVVPPYLGGFGADSGFVAYASRWQANGALFQMLKQLESGLFAAAGWTGWPAGSSGLAVRLICATIVAAVALLLARTPARNTFDFIQRAFVVVLLLFLLSPAQFPWYATWVLIFAPFLPLAGLSALTVLLPLYYVSFFLIARPGVEQWYSWLIWVEWLPIWLVLMADGVRAWRRPLVADLR
jgi:alpha-1,6-mannosyltransferase